MNKPNLFIYFIALLFISTHSFADTSDENVPVNANAYPPGCIPTVGLPVGPDTPPCEAYFPMVSPEIVANTQLATPDTTTENTAISTESAPIEKATTNNTKTIAKNTHGYSPSSRYYYSQNYYYPEDYYPYYPYYVYYPYYSYPNNYNYLGAFITGLAFGALWNAVYYHNFNSYYWHGGAWNNYYAGHWYGAYSHGAYWNGAHYARWHQNVANQLNATHLNAAAAHQNLNLNQRNASQALRSKKTNLQHLNKTGMKNHIHNKNNVNRNFQHHDGSHGGGFGGRHGHELHHNAAFHGNAFHGFHGSGFGGHGSGMRFHGGRR